MQILKNIHSSFAVTICSGSLEFTGITYTTFNCIFVLNLILQYYAWHGHTPHSINLCHLWQQLYNPHLACPSGIHFSTSNGLTNRTNLQNGAYFHKSNLCWWYFFFFVSEAEVKGLSLTRQSTDKKEVWIGISLEMLKRMSLSSLKTNMYTTNVQTGLGVNYNEPERVWLLIKILKYAI